MTHSIHQKLELLRRVCRNLVSPAILVAVCGCGPQPNDASTPSQPAPSAATPPSNELADPSQPTPANVHGEKSSATAADAPPDEADAWYRQACKFHRGGERRKAIVCLDYALAADPDHLPSCALRAEFHYGAEQYGPAIQLCERIVRLDPQRVEPRLCRSMSLACAERNAEAIAAARADAAQFPHEARCAMVLAYAYFMADEYQQAVDQCEQILAADPANAWMQTIRTAALAGVKDIPAARESLRRAQRYGASDHALSALRLLVWANEDADDTSEAVAALSGMIHHQPTDNDLRALKAITMILDDQVEPAVGELNQIVSIEPRNSLAQVGFALVWLRVGEYAKAIPRLKVAVEFDATNELALSYLSYIYIRFPEPHGNGTLAVEYAERLCALSEWSDPTDLDLLASAYARAGQFHRAILWQQRALQHAESDEQRQEMYEHLELFQAGQPFQAGRGQR